ncbi:MAG: hypothetical protein ACLQVN_21920 [Bryobacteraceae bacterium]
MVEIVRFVPASGEDGGFGTRDPNSIPPNEGEALDGEHFHAVGRLVKPDEIGLDPVDRRRFPNAR